MGNEVYQWLSGDFPRRHQSERSAPSTTARDVATLAEFMAEHGTTVAQAAVTLGWPKDRARLCWRRIKKQLGAQAND
jgi:hypothetical protein